MVCEHDLVSFIKRRLYDFTDDEIIKCVAEHIRYGTISIVLDDEKIIGVLRVNIEGNVAIICDLIIEEGYSFNAVVKQMTIDLWKKFPYVKYFKYWRTSKYPLRKPRIYSIKDFVKVK